MKLNQLKIKKRKEIIMKKVVSQAKKANITNKSSK